MWFDNDLFRLSYLPAVIIPLLLALFTTDLKLIQIIPDMIGWSFLLISGNLVNDYVDMDRKLPVGKRGLLALSALFFIFGASILKDKILYVIIFIAIGLLYHFKLKGMPYFDLIILLDFLPPYLSLTKNIDWKLIIFFALIAILALLVDKASDERKYKRNAKQISSMVLLLTLFLISFTIYTLWAEGLYFYLFTKFFVLPLIVVFSVFLFLVFKGYLLKLSLSIKILGVYAGCVFLFYLIAVLVQMGKII